MLTSHDSRYCLLRAQLANVSRVALFSVAETLPSNVSRETSADFLTDVDCTNSNGEMLIRDNFVTALESNNITATLRLVQL